ncbi:MAG: hypothetical protein ACPL07_01200 [Candidatus Bathyarchaeia archaeon]
MVVVVVLAFLLPYAVWSFEWWSLESQGQKIQASLPSWKQTEKSHFGTLTFGSLDDELETLEGRIRFLKELQGDIQAGAFFLRPHPSKIFAWGFTEKERGKYYWAVTDFVVRTVQDYNAHLLATIYTWNPWDQKEPAVFDPWYLEEPRDWESYVAWLSALVERYDGDGVDDMPGLRYPVRYFEIGNEPRGVYYGCYIRLLKSSYDAIKRANPEAVVMNGAIRYEDVDGFLKEELENYIDVFNTHDMNFEDVSTLRARVGKPVWLSEILPGDPYEDMNREREYEVAKRIVEVYPMALSRGVEKVFLAQPRLAFGIYGEGILMSTHRFLQEKIDFFERVETLNADAITFYRFIKGNHSIVITSGWRGGLSRREILLPTEASTVIVIEATKPDHRSWSVEAQGGHAVIDFRLTDDPQLMIEEVS